MIDIRGQNVSNTDLSMLYDDIMERTNNGVTILFKVEQEDYMAVGFRVRFYWYQIGNGDFLHSFFQPQLTIQKNKNGVPDFLLL